MKNPIIRIAQEAPGAPAPDLGAAPPPAPDMGGGMDMGAMMGGMGAPPAAPMAAPIAQANEPILAPLENLGAILKDINITKLLSEKLSNTGHQDTTGEEEIANFIWRSYGGDFKTGLISGRVGQRAKGKLISEPEELIEVIDYPEFDLEAVENRWIRLPEGKTMRDLGITAENVEDMVKSMSLSTSLQSAAAAKAGGGGGALASISIDKMIKIAHNLDMMGYYDLADKII